MADSQTRSQQILSVLSKLKQPDAGGSKVIGRRVGMTGMLAEQAPGDSAIRPDLNRINSELVGPNPEMGGNEPTQASTRNLMSIIESARQAELKKLGKKPGALTQSDDSGLQI